MRLLPAMEAIWRSGDYTGDQRPMARVTIERPKIALRSYGLLRQYSILRTAPSGVGSAVDIPGLIDPHHPRRVTNTYADLLFTAPNTPVELRNVKTVDWVRSLDTDAATLTMTLANTAPKPETDPVLNDASGAPLPEQKDLDRPGWYTYNRGKAPWSKRWKHAANSWAGDAGQPGPHV